MGFSLLPPSERIKPRDKRGERCVPYPLHTASTVTEVTLRGFGSRQQQELRTVGLSDRKSVV